MRIAGVLRIQFFSLSHSLERAALFYDFFSLCSLHILRCAKLHFRAYAHRRGRGNGEKGRVREIERNICKQVSVELMRNLCGSA